MPLLSYLEEFRGHISELTKHDRIGLSAQYSDWYVHRTESTLDWINTRIL